MNNSFDVAAELLRRSPNQTMSTVKLQKLTFYVFGWYAKITGTKLFEDDLCAMPKGPIASRLFSAHYGQSSVSLSDIESRTSQEELDLAASDVVDTVLATYGEFSPWELVEISHEEEVWQTTWNQAKLEGKRSKPMDNDRVVDFFLDKKDATYQPHGMKEVALPVLSFLPDALVRVVTEEEMTTMESEPQEVPMGVWDQLAPEYKSLLSAI